jgi:phage portal protein BeeE
VNFIRSLNRKQEARSISLGALLQEFVNYQGTSYNLFPGGTLAGDKETIAATFQGYVQQAYRSSGPVFACVTARMLLFQEARFQFRQMRNGMPGDLFGSLELKPLESPWPNATTGDLLARAEQDNSLAGNAYFVRIKDRIYRRRPDWITIILGSNKTTVDPDEAELIGYGYTPGGPGSGEKPVVYLPEQVAHYAPIPDPLARYRGMSWIDTILRDVTSDAAATAHTQRYFEAGATPNLIVTADPSMSIDALKLWKQEFKDEYEGGLNAFKTLFLGGGASAQVVGNNLEQINLSATQGISEARIASAAGVPPMLVGFHEGLAASTLANFAQAQRHFANSTIRPLWRNFAGSIATIINVPPGADLWYDDRHVPALQEDVKDAATVQQSQSTTIHQLITAGFESQSVIDAVTSGDFKRLSHTGLFSVQLQPAGVVGEGKGAVLGGTVVPDKKPAQLNAASANARALLEPFVKEETA